MKLYCKIALLVIFCSMDASVNSGVFGGSIGKSTWRLIQAMHLPCQKFTFTEVFHRPGCDAVKVTNHFCAGKCLSVFYPTLPRKCFACHPKKVDFLNVKFNCSGANANILAYKTVEIVKSCQCTRIKCMRRYFPDSFGRVV